MVADEVFIENNPRSNKMESILLYGRKFIKDRIYWSSRKR